MTLFKTSFWTGLSTLIRLVSQFIVVKVLAVYVGPVGFALMGQFQNLITMVLTFSGNMIQTGVVKYVSEFRENEAVKAKILSTALRVCFISAAVIACILFFGRNRLAELILKQANFGWLIGILAFTLIFFILNTLCLSILNGEQTIKRLTFANMGSSIIGLLFTGILARYFGLKGALLALVLSQSIVFFFTLSLVWRSPWFKKSNFNQKMDRDSLIKLLKFAMMAITSALMLPTVQIIIREHIAHVLSWQDAGYWQAVTRISDAYLLLITSTLSVYYLPKLSSLQSNHDIKREIYKAYKVILPLVFALALIIFLFKKTIILILFSPQFMAVAPLFLFQLLGDVFKIGSWLVGYTFLAKAMTKLFICSEVIFSISYCLLVFVFTKYFGLMGVTMAFALNYLLYWGFMGVVFENINGIQV